MESQRSIIAKNAWRLIKEREEASLTDIILISGEFNYEFKTICA